ncbi:BON domain-containing protein [Castellaniella hirudinis]|uniref:BON domain-containing protein n=1 Tax=Castellaniella hirudinis TaxID=1144617 RepID=UPI0039C1C0CF
MMPLSLRPLSRILLALACLLALPGCGVLLVGGAAATTASVATDRRTTGEQVDDQTIELRVANDMTKAFGDTANITAMSYAGRLLLAGDVATDADRQKAADLARVTPQVTSVDNYLRVGPLTPLSARTNDTWITSKVKSQLIGTKNVPFRTIKLTTHRGVVYLMGKVTATEGDLAAGAAASVNGVNQVVKLFQIVSRESLITDEGKPAPVIEPSASSATPPSSADGNAGAQPMPVQ